MDLNANPAGKSRYAEHAEPLTELLTPRGVRRFKMTIKEAKQFYDLTTQWLGAGGKPVHPDTAQVRANTCLQCPMHEARPIYEALAGAAALTVRRQIELKNKLNLRVQGEKSLHVCGGCNCILRLKVWAPIKFISEHTDTSKLAPGCWVIKEQEEIKTT